MIRYMRYYMHIMKMSILHMGLQNSTRTIDQLQHKKTHWFLHPPPPKEFNWGWTCQLSLFSIVSHFFSNCSSRIWSLISIRWFIINFWLYCSSLNLFRFSFCVFKKKSLRISIILLIVNCGGWNTTVI